jgi:transcriptional regulator with GAF, ATPase, and Fis domain
VGRASHCDVQIDDASISRQHFCLFIGTHIEIEDLGSSNGTLVAAESGTRFLADTSTPKGAPFRRLSVGERVTLNVGDIVRAGSAIVIVERRETQPSQATIRPLPSDPRASPTNLFWPAVLVNPELRKLYEVAAMAAGTDISVLILGETGVGKEVFAEFIHRRSHRGTRPFLRLNCAALSESLLESELFGHEKGAFTGALQSKPGLLEATDGGTVFLDEVGELPLSLQVKLLRVLDERVVRRVGSNRPRTIDVRFITATNRDLKREVVSGRFRGDLYFRINGTSFSIPPLRERKDEIEPLARYFLTWACERSGRRVPAITAEAHQKMLSYGWWGNVRELKNAMERASFLCGDGPLLASHLPDDPLPLETTLEESTDLLYSGGVSVEAPTLGAVGGSLLYGRAVPGQISTLKELAKERDHDEVDSAENEPARLLKALQECGGNQTRAAQLLGISRRTLINRLDLHKLPRPRKGRGEPPSE